MSLPSSILGKSAYLRMYTHCQVFLCTFQLYPTYYHIHPINFSV